MKKIILFFSASFLIGHFAFAASIEVAVTMNPAGSFKVTTNAVKGSAIKTPTGFIAKDIIVNLKTIETGVSLRDKHAKEKLNVEKYPQAKLLKAQGKNGKGLAIIALKGKKLKVKGTYKIKGQNLTCKFKMKLSELDVTNIRYMGIGVQDEVEVTVNVPVKASKKTKAPSKTAAM